MRSRRAGVWRAAGLSLLVLVWAAVTRGQVARWADDVTLWRAAVAVTPTKPRPVLNLGRALELQGQWAAAFEFYQRTWSFALDPRRPEPANRFARAAAETNLAHIYLRTGRTREAVTQLTHTLRWWPTFPYAHYNLGRLLWASGDCENGMAEIEGSRQQDPALSLPGVPCGQE